MRYWRAEKIFVMLSFGSVVLTCQLPMIAKHQQYNTHTSKTMCETKYEIEEITKTIRN